MTREEAKELLYNISAYDIDAQRGIAKQEAIEIAIEALEQESCEDEYIKVPKKALKYRTAGMVAYNAEWLKNHFDIERAVICGAQESILDKIRAEIEWYKDDKIIHAERNEMIDITLDIIDKYKAECEDEEC